MAERLVGASSASLLPNRLRPGTRGNRPDGWQHLHRLRAWAWSSPQWTKPLNAATGS